MFMKLLIAPLFTTSFSNNDFLKLSVPRRHIYQFAFFGLSFSLNMYLFVNMEEDKVNKEIYVTAFVRTVFGLIPLAHEFRVMLSGNHRTSLAADGISFSSTNSNIILGESPTNTGFL